MIRRSLVALEELGVPYKQVALRPWADAADKATLARLNPNARVPVLDDDGLILWESMAINLYLADQYGSAPLWPSAAHARALIYQWSLWGQTEIDVMARHRDRFSGVPARVERARSELHARLAILNDALTDRLYLLGNDFTFADINLASTLIEPWEVNKPDAGDVRPGDKTFPAVGAWLARCTERASWRKVSVLKPIVSPRPFKVTM